MKQYIGKRVKLQIVIDGKNLFFTGLITEDTTGTHTSFIDKYGKHFTFHDEYIKQVMIL